MESGRRPERDLWGRLRLVTSPDSPQETPVHWQKEEEEEDDPQSDGVLLRDFARSDITSPPAAAPPPSLKDLLLAFATEKKKKKNIRKIIIKGIMSFSLFSLFPIREIIKGGEREREPLLLLEFFVMEIGREGNDGGRSRGGGRIDHRCISFI